MFIKPCARILNFIKGQFKKEGEKPIKKKEKMTKSHGHQRNVLSYQGERCQSLT